MKNLSKDKYFSSIQNTTNHRSYFKKNQLLENHVLLHNSQVTAPQFQYIASYHSTYTHSNQVAFIFKARFSPHSVVQLFRTATHTVVYRSAAGRSQAKWGNLIFSVQWAGTTVGNLLIPYQVKSKLL